MKKKSTYRLLVQSEEPSRNILEIAVYALVAVSALASIWQFAEQSNALSLDRIGTAAENHAEVRIAS
jgi:hypothetical protein